MQSKTILLAAPMLLLAACHMKVGDDTKDGNSASVSVGEDGNVQVKAADGAQGVSVSVPGFSAKVNIPGLDLNSDSHTDIDGMKLYPGTKIIAVNVNAHDDAGTVDMRFTSPGAPGAIADYYASAARAEDFTDVAVKKDGDKALFTAKKPDGDLVSIALAPDTAGSAGQIKITDSKK